MKKQLSSRRAKDTPAALRASAQAKGAGKITTKGAKESPTEKSTPVKSTANGFAKATIVQRVRSGHGLSAAQTRNLSVRLTELKTELKEAVVAKAALFNQAAHSESLIKGDDAEVAEKQRLNNAALQELDFLKNRMMLVERALLKMIEGVFGICEESEEPIGFERLVVVPWARFAVHIQEMREKRMREHKISRLRSEA